MTSAVAIGLTAVLLAAACALAGSFLVLRRMAMMADAISHSVLPGLVAGYVLAQGPNLLVGILGAVAAAFVTVGLVEALARSRKVKEDSAIGLVFPAMFALGVVIVSKFFANVHIDTDAVLYGEIAYVPFDILKLGGRELGPTALWMSGGLLALNGLFLALVFKELKLSSFDGLLAQSLGFRPALMHGMLMAMVAVTTVGAFSAVGAILAVALLIVPVAIAQLLTRRLPILLGLACTIGVAGALSGFGLAQALDVSISGMMATVLGGLFLVAVALSPSQGLVAQAARRRRQRLQFAVDMLVVHLLTHEGTPAQPEESRFVHLERELNWSQSWAAQIVAEANRLRVIRIAESVLALTPAGRERAKEVLRRTGTGELLPA